MSYRKPLLTELLAEVHFEAFGPNKVVRLANDLQVLGLTDVEFGLSPATPSKPPLQFRIRCWSPDRKRLVQASADVLVVNHVGEYLGWVQYLEYFRAVTRCLEDGLAVRSVSLQAVDKLSVPSDGFLLGRYLNCEGKHLPALYADCAEAADIILGRGQVSEDGFNRQITLAVRRSGTHNSTVEVTITTVFHDRLVKDEKVEDLLCRLRTQANTTFESLITDKTRDLMGGWIK